MRRTQTGLQGSSNGRRRRVVRVAGVLVSALCVGALLLVGPAVAQEGADTEPASMSPGEPAEVEPESDAPAAGSISNLVPVGAALTSSGIVRFAGTVDRGTVAETEVDGTPGNRFVLVGPAGHSLEVEVGGKLPQGFDVALSVVVVGEAIEGRIRATDVLIPGAAEWPDPNRGLKAVMIVNILIWLGLFAYVLRLGLKLRQLEGR